jgi:predicted phage replisome organizer
MAEVKWIKFYIDMFDKRKIKKIRRLPDGDKILLFWVMLLATAGKCNAGGMIFITENVPFDEEDLADEFDLEVNTIRLALEVFVKLDMISISKEGYILVNGWEEYQSADKLAEIREQNRLAQQRSRTKKKLLQDVNDTSYDSHMTSHGCHDTDIEVDKEKEKDIDLFTTTTTEAAPTLSEVYIYFRSCLDEDYISESEKFHAYNAKRGWDCLPNWKATADLWIARIDEKG